MDFFSFESKALNNHSEISRYLKSDVQKIQSPPEDF